MEQNDPMTTVPWLGVYQGRLEENVFARVLSDTFCFQQYKGYSEDNDFCDFYLDVMKWLVQ